MCVSCNFGSCASSTSASSTDSFMPLTGTHFAVPTALPIATISPVNLCQTKTLTLAICNLPNLRSKRIDELKQVNCARIKWRKILDVYLSRNCAVNVTKGFTLRHIDMCCRVRHARRRQAKYHCTVRDSLIIGVSVDKDGRAAVCS